MRKIKQAPRLKYNCGINDQKIARNYRDPLSIVVDYLRRAKTNGLRFEIVATDQSIVLGLI